MNDALQELQEFHHFLGKKLLTGVEPLSPEQALQQWREMHPDPEVFEEDVAAIQEALDDMAAGDKGRPVDVVLEEIRARFGLPSPS